MAGAGERILAAFIAQPRGATIGGVAPGAVGGRTIKHENRAAQANGLQLALPMALALTESRLVVLAVSRPIAMGRGGDVKRLVSAVPLSDIDSIEVKRLLVGKVVIVPAPLHRPYGRRSRTQGFARHPARCSLPLRIEMVRPPAPTPQRTLGSVRSSMGICDLPAFGRVGR